MRRHFLKDVKIIGGRFKGQKFELEADIKDMPDGSYQAAGNLAMLAMSGNWAARNAIDVDNYTVDDAPFYYGKINGMGYIISHKDLDLK